MCTSETKSNLPVKTKTSEGTQWAAPWLHPYDWGLVWLMHIAEAGLALGEGEVILKILSEPLGRGGCLGERPGEKPGKAAQSWAPGMT